MANAKKPEEKKAVVLTTADNKPTVKETSVASAKKETKSASSVLAAKPAANTAKKAVTKKASAAKTESAAKKTAAKTEKATKTVEKKSKSTAKSTAKKATDAAKTTAAKAPAKRGGRKPAPITINTICAKLEKKIGKTKAAAIKEKIAVEIEVWGFEDGSNSYMYVEVNDGKVTVSPHNYEAKNFRVSLSFANAIAFVEGKITMKNLVESGDFYAEGNIASAVKLSAIF